MKYLILLIAILVSPLAFGQGGAIQRNYYTTNSTPFYVTTAAGNGTTDDTASIQANIVAMEALGGGVLMFPHGTYKVTATLIINTTNVVIQGEGERTVFQASGDYGDVFYARPDVDPTTPATFTGIQFLNFQINAGATNNRTSGAAIHTKWTHNALISDVRIGSFPPNITNILPFYDGLNMENQANFVARNCQIYVRAHGITDSSHKLAGTGGAGEVGGNYFDGLITGNCNLWGDILNREGTNSVAIWLKGGNGLTNGTGGFQVEQTAVFGFWNGILATGTNREIFIGHAFAADNCRSHGIRIGVNGCTILQMTGAWSAGCGADAVHIDDDTTSGTWNPQVSIVGGTFYATGTNGIYLGAGQSTILGTQVYQQTNGSSIVFGTKYIGFPRIIGGRIESVVNNSDLAALAPTLIIGNTGTQADILDGLDTGFGSSPVARLTNYSAISASSVYSSALTASGQVVADSNKKLVGATITSLAAAFPPVNLAATTNVDCSTAYMFYRSTTNVAIPFQLTNEVSGVSYEIQLFNTGGTATPNVTITASTGHTMSAPNITAAQSITYGSPVANACLRILVTVNGNTNRVDFMDNYK